MNLGDPVAVLLAATRALSASGIASAAYGGLALAAYGEPRETKDADLAVVGVSGAAAADSLRRSGLEVLVAFDRTPFGGHLVSRVTLLGGPDVVGLNVADFVEPRSGRYARDALARSLDGSLRGEPVRLLSPEDFVVFKVLSTRDRDLEDAASVMRSLESRLDVAWIERELPLLASEIVDHDIRGRWLRLLALSRS